jgi:putative CocE/NonD family hydrolase
VICAWPGMQTCNRTGLAAIIPAMSVVTRFGALVFIVLAACVAVTRAQSPLKPLPDNAVPVMALEVMIPMRDGVRLATNIYRPAVNGSAAPGKFPAVLLRTPYDKASRAQSFAADFVARGYVVVVQDVRGRYRSEGHWSFLRDDLNDGFDTAQWIGQQDWSDQSIGTIGTSYEGGAQHALGIGNAPYVKAMVPLFSVSDTGQYGIRHNGAFELRFFNWVFSMGDPGNPPNLIAAQRATSEPGAAQALADLSTQVKDYVQALPLRAGTTPLKFAPDYERWLIEAMSHGDNDQYWKDSGVDVVDHLAEYKDIPEYHVTGWYDSWSLPVANLNFPGLRTAKKSLQRLIVGPWVHSSQGRAHAGAAEFTPDATIDLNAFELRWFDHWLKGVDNGVEREAPVRIYVMGGGDAHRTEDGRIFVGGHWRDEQEWPLARSVATTYYLHGDGTMSAAKPNAHAPIPYRFDPKNPVPTLGGNNSSQGALATQGVEDQRCRPGLAFCTDSNPLSARNDVVVFQTPPLSEDMEITGRLIVKLWAASDSPDTDFTAKLIDVYPPNHDFPGGFDLNVGDSIVRARYRNSLSKAELLKPGKPYEFTIELYPTSLLVKRGHRLRLDISSSNFPRFDVNPNTGEPLNDNRSWRIAQNSIYLDPSHPSRVILPVIPAQH